MPDPVTGITAGATIFSSVSNANAQKKSAATAAGAQTRASEAAISENRRQFERTQELLSPYVSAGTDALSRERDLSGLNGQEAQAKAIAAIESSPGFQNVASQGEKAILANASATGGLRGGNTQGFLAEFRPNLLQEYLERESARLTGLRTAGQNAAAGTGAAGLQTGANIGNIQLGIGDIQAREALARGQAGIDLTGGITEGIGIITSGYENRNRNRSGDGYNYLPSSTPMGPAGPADEADWPRGGF